MKKILVLSDSHGNVNNMVTAVRNTHPDQIIHLGDCWVDAEKLHQQFPMIMMEQVPGNCDCNQGAGGAYSSYRRKADIDLSWTYI